MLIAHLTITGLVGLLLSFTWSSKNWTNVIIKLCLVAWTFWTGMLLAGQVVPIVAASGMRLI